MRPRGRRDLQKTGALTIIEVLVVLVVIALLVGLAVPWIQNRNTKQARIDCANNLKGIAGGFCMFAVNNSNRFSWQISSSNGGTMELTSNASLAWEHFAAHSNENSAAMMLHCPADAKRRKTQDFKEFNSNQSLSYFIALGASNDVPNSILSGDRNLLLDGKALENQIVTLSSNANVAFDRNLHREVGNILFGDASVQLLTSPRLQEAFRDSARVSKTTLMIP